MLNNLLKSGVLPVVISGLVLILPDKLHWIVIVVLALNFFYNAYTKKSKINIKLCFVFSIPFIVFIFGLIHFNHHDLKFVQRTLPFLLYPIFLSPYLNLGVKKNNQLKDCFFLTYIFSGFFYIIVAYANFRLNKKEWWTTFYDSETLRNSIRYIPNIELDPIYVSFYFCIAVVLSFSLYLKKRRIIFLVAIFLFVAFIFLLANKMAILSLLVVTLVFSLKHFKVHKLFYVIFTIMFFVILLNNKRFKEFVNPETYTGIVQAENSTSIRIALFKSSLTLVPQNYLCGIGFSSVKQNVSHIFIHKFNGDKEYNTHNQFMSVLLATGIFGLFLFVYYFWFIIKIALLAEDQVFSFVIVIIIMNLFTENMLERQFGVYLIAYLITFLGYLNIKKAND